MKLQKSFEIYRFKYIYLLALWIAINSIGPVRIAKFSQFISVIFGIVGLLIFIGDVCIGKYKKHPFFISSVIIVLASILSMIANGCSFFVKNVYSIISLIINFFVLFSFSQDSEFNEKILKINRTLFIIITVVSFVNIVLLFFEVSIPIGDYYHLADAKFIGLDNIRGRFTGVQLNPNGLSRYALAGVISGLIILFFTKNPAKNSFRFIILFGILVNVLAILLSQSRGSLLALVVGGFILLFTPIIIRIRQESILKRIFFWMLLFVSFLLSVSLFFKSSDFLVINFPTIRSFDVNYENNLLDSSDDNNLGNNPLVDRGEREKDILEDDMTNGRITLIKNGINATISKHPFFGLTYGGNTVHVQDYIKNNEIAVPNYLFRTSGSMHNIIVQSYVNNGVLGFIGMFSYLSLITKKYVEFILGKPSEEVTSRMIKPLRLYGFIFGSMLVLHMVEWVFYYDFDNHLLNFQNLIMTGWFISSIEKHRSIESLE